MKCTGYVKEKNKLGKTVNRMCNEKLDEHAIFCPRCGKATDALSTGLSMRQNIVQAWKGYKDGKSRYIGLGLFLILAVYIPLALIIYLTLESYWLSNLLLLFWIPLALIPFAISGEEFKTGFRIGSFFRKLKYYPGFWMLVLISIIYFFLLKVVCTGFLLGVATDPILHLVRLIMVLYWITIISPVPLLMTRKNLSPYKAIRIAYKAGEETRWQQFYTLLAVVVFNLAGTAVFLAGLLISMPFSYLVLERYYRQMQEYGLFKL